MIVFRRKKEMEAAFNEKFNRSPVRARLLHLMKAQAGKGHEVMSAAHFVLHTVAIALQNGVAIRTLLANPDDLLYALVAKEDQRAELKEAINLIKQA